MSGRVVLLRAAEEIRVRNPGIEGEARAMRVDWHCPIDEVRIVSPRKIVVIAASRGGFYALRTLAAGLPATLPAAVCIVLHIGRHESSLPELMRRWGPLYATHAKDGEALVAGRIYIAPPDRHLLVEHGCMRLSDSAPENFSRPAADPLMRSASMAYGNRVVGVVLSGDLDDGAAGLAMVSARGGQCLVQRPAECEAPSMPNAALRAVDGAAIVESLETMAAAIVSAVHSSPRKPEDTVKSDRLVKEEAEVAARGFVSPHELDRIGRRSRCLVLRAAGHYGNWKMIVRIATAATRGTRFPNCRWRMASCEMSNARCGTPCVR
ncbi:chemotaxis protein CheB [Paraburkholderia tropica]|uniref:chemotaxis protein CheB n=1 Tax=Paraburkholderia tropica TaxID=92647 RepID=UPI002F91AB42